jgi:hypothetical protein
VVDGLLPGSVDGGPDDVSCSSDFLATGHWRSLESQSGNRPSPGAYYIEALDAFRRRDYHEATRLTEHAAVDTPQDVKVHQLLTQTLFALGVYRQAAIEAHAARALGPALHWESLASYYEAALKLVPADRLAAELVKDLGGKAAESVAKIAAPSADVAKAR